LWSGLFFPVCLVVVVGVDVDVAGGTVRVTGDPLPGDAALREAVEEAGYEYR